MKKNLTIALVVMTVVGAVMFQLGMLQSFKKSENNSLQPIEQSTKVVLMKQEKVQVVDTKQEKNPIVFCDISGNRYQTEDEARLAGLAESEFGATYCPEYTSITQEPVMHISWDINNDGINDCENDGTCDDSVDYSQPKTQS